MVTSLVSPEYRIIAMLSLSRRQHLGHRRFDRLRERLSDLGDVRLKAFGEIRHDRVHVAAYDGVGMPLDPVPASADRPFRSSEWVGLPRPRPP
jgi:hypothetical protein